MKLPQLLGTCLFLLPGLALASPVDSLLTALNQALAHRTQYDGQREWQLRQLRDEFNAPGTGDSARFAAGLRSYEEYKAYQYDSAFAYCQRLEWLAGQLHDPDRLASAHLKRTFILLSTGLFKEATEALAAIDPRPLAGDRRLEYYLMQVRTNSDLAEFSRDQFYRPRYAARALAYSDTVLRLSAAGSPLQLELQEDLASRTNRLAAGEAAYQRLRRQPNVSLHHRAIEAAILARLYRQLGQDEKAFELLLVSAIADVQSATKETTSLSAVADYCYQRGDVRNAYTFVKAAREDAAFYNARQRKVQLSQLSATIEEQKLALIDRQRQQLTIYAVLASTLTVLVAAFAGLSYVQLRRLRITSVRLATATQVAETRNVALAATNVTLAEANTIKEEYVGYSFYHNAQYLDKLAVVKKNLDALASTRQVTGLLKLAGSIDVKQARSELVSGFDLVFLRLFPNFVAEFNALFPPAARVQPAEGQLLTTELRIFALIRLGIQDNERISRMLGYSVNTIYTYKTRVKNRSLVPNEEFEARVLAIRGA